jgi:hypothetical protein
MFSLILSFLLALTPFSQDVKPLSFDNRANSKLLMGKGDKSGVEYWDIVITRQPTDGILIKLPYTRKGGKFSFDLHHRIAMTENFGQPAEVTTVVEILSGGTTSLGVFTLSDMVQPTDRFDEGIVKVSQAEIDRFVTPLSRRTITMETRPGPQSISIVGQTVTITRGVTSTRIDTPGTRIAVASNFKFEEITTANPLGKGPGGL